MPLYNVKWEIDIDAKNPREAAKKALEIQRDKDSIATCFNVKLKTKEEMIDLFYKLPTYSKKSHESK